MTEPVGPTFHWGSGPDDDVPPVLLGPNGAVVPNPEHPVGAQLAALLANGGADAEAAAAQLELLNAGILGIRALEHAKRAAEMPRSGGLEVSVGGVPVQALPGIVGLVKRLFARS
jgi:hypothetical protein